ncbi:MAG: ATP-dependent DNA ligase [Acidimicrobiia bacterium]|nr:ATP-dependent DNA ligase [Acidimicrobiia bacterium]
MLLYDVVEASTTIRATRSRLAKTASIAGLLSGSAPGEISLVIAYLSGELPQGKIGIGYSLAYDVDPDPAESPTLTIEVVDEAFTALAGVAGPGSQAARRSRLTGLMASATGPEQAFIRALILGELRQGASTGIMEEAIARAADLPVGLVRKAAMVSSDLAAVGRRALADGAAGLSEFTLELFSPLQPMLAQSAADVPAAFEKTGPAAVEYKIDGARIQVHRAADTIRVYTRNLRDITEWIPEVVEAVAALEVDSTILDGEAIALDGAGRPRPFQVTMSRFGRQLEVDRIRHEVPLVGLFFDCLHLDGRDLIDEPASVRAAALAGVAGDGLLAPRLEPADPADAQAFFDRALADGHEGVVVKALDAPYEAGRRGSGWIKVKPVHTLDLVVLGVEWGSGRRQGWLSNLHLGARDPAGGFVMLGKTFKGLTDELLAWQTERFLALETHREGHIVFVRPEQVVEIAFDGVQQSSKYPGGVALRFARVKGYRDDKTAGEVDTIDAVRAFLEKR